jgi:Icc-related predicted phosphoesterase
MKLWILSDLHLETTPLEGPLTIPDADVCVVAGDIMNRGILPSIDWLASNIGVHIPVVFVAGNHEFYKSFLVDSLEAASKVGTGGGVHFLENSCATSHDVVFCGATLWTDFDLFGSNWREIAMHHVKGAMNDYRQIKMQKQPYFGLRPIHTYRKHVESRKFLERSIRSNRAKKVVVVTHHAPSMTSIESKYRDDIVTTAFASDLNAFIEGKEPTLWVHGHVHSASDYTLARTRIVCNPRGYPSETSFAAFDRTLVIDV